MYAFRVGPRLLGAAAICLGVVVCSTAAAQDAPAEGAHQHDASRSGDQHAGHDMSQMHHEHGGAGAPMSREGSGTSWLPDDSPMYAIHVQKGSWQVMFHENIFLQFLHESGDRGDDQLGSINWVMGAARRSLGRGTLGLRAMFSAEPWTIGGCGYPNLLASGERCEGAPIHDRQHPHDLFMELAATYDAPLRGSTRWQIYGAPAGEPALGPVAFPHRISAMSNPIAPITHHWMDSTHISFGVVTAGVYGTRWKAEASAFNGREPDEDRTDIDFGALDSVSGRFWYLPTSRLSLQVSAGRLNDAELAEGGDTSVDVTRVTASASYHRAVDNQGIWATTLGWGHNDETGHGSNALLVETTVSLAQRHTWFGRFEIVVKSAHDLVVSEPPEGFTVAKLQGGYTRYLSSWRRFQPGLGAGASVGFVPESLASTYGSRANAGFSIFLTLRPEADK